MKHINDAIKLVSASTGFTIDFPGFDMEFARHRREFRRHSG